MRHRPLDFDMPQLVTLADTPVAINAIGQGLAHAHLNLDEAAAMLRVVREFMVALAAVENGKCAAGLAAPADDDEVTGVASLAEFMAARIR
jgi:hypothetical protein